MFLIYVLCSFSFAGIFVNMDGDKKYVNDFGEVVKDTWVWVDTDNDSIAECYRFDSFGHPAVNYKDKYGKSTNENGQLIEDGIVIKKMLSSGKVINDKTPAKGILAVIGGILNLKNKIVKDKYTGKETELIEYESIPDINAIDGGCIVDSYDSTIGPNEIAEGGIIYANGKASELSDNVRLASGSYVVPGKDIRKFITAKNKCIEKLERAYVYGGDEWLNVICLQGHKASIKVLLDGNNTVRLEVAHQTHGEDTVDTDMSLDMYVDGELVTGFDEFVDSKPEIIEEYLDNAKTVEFKVNITNGAKGREVYIRNGRLRKIKEKDK